MKKVILIAAVLALAAFQANAQIRIGGKTINTKKAVEAVKDVAKAVTLSDEDIANLSRESVEWMDRNNPVADEESPYTQRLNRLTSGITKASNGLPLNFKVYLVVDVNAFACGDGSIRVFSSLMDIMDDDELMAIIGHEIGHVVHADVKDAMKNAYLASAARNAISATNGKLAKLTDSQLGDVVQAFTDAQFSQKQEYAADEYGFNFCVENGFSPDGMANSLQKLVDLYESGGQKASAISKMFSSHPDSKNRAARMREKAAAYKQ